MNWNEINSRPTLADEVSPQVDDAQVISKTLPAPKPAQRGSLAATTQGYVDAAHRYITRQPLQGMLIAAATGAVFTAMLLVAAPRRARIVYLARPGADCG